MFRYLIGALEEILSLQALSFYESQADLPQTGEMSKMVFRNASNVGFSAILSHFGSVIRLLRSFISQKAPI